MLLFVGCLRFPIEHVVFWIQDLKSRFVHVKSKQHKQEQNA